MMLFTDKQLFAIGIVAVAIAACLMMCTKPAHSQVQTCVWPHYCSK